DADETAKVLKVGGDARLGLVVGQEEIVVGIPTNKKSVLPRHTGILGTTGGGKSTTVSELVHQFQKAGVATIILDVEGEYTEIDKPTGDPQMLAALKRRGLKAGGTPNLRIFHLVGRETSREAPGATITPFCLKFSELSPYAVMEILDMSEAQQERFYKAYDATRAVLRDLKIFPATPDDQNLLLELDELETGYPNLTLSYLMDIAAMIRHEVAKEPGDPQHFNQAAAAGKTPTPVVVIIEEAHEFLSAQRVRQMPVLFEQVAKIAKRGRKRWLGLLFVTQLPQHLPDEVLGLINNFILHKIS